MAFFKVADPGFYVSDLRQSIVSKGYNVSMGKNIKSW